MLYKPYRITTMWLQSSQNAGKCMYVTGLECLGNIGTIMIITIRDFSIALYHSLKGVSKCL